MSDIGTVELGLGTWPLAGVFSNQNRVMGWGEVSAHQAVETIMAAVECGISWFDVADSYGDGIVLDHLATALRGVPRASFKIALKLGYYSPTGDNPYEIGVLSRQFDRSMRRLNLSYVDELSFHNLYFGDGNRHLDGAIELFDRWQGDGAARDVGRRWGHEFTGAAFMGVGRDNVAELEAEAATILDQAFPRAPLHCKVNLLASAAHIAEFDAIPPTRVRVVNKPLAQGRLAWGMGSLPRYFEKTDHRHYRRAFNVAEVAKLRLALQSEFDRSGLDENDLASIALAFVMSRPAVSLVMFGAKEPAQVKEIADACAQAREIPQAIFTSIRARLEQDNLLDAA